MILEELYYLYHIKWCVLLRRYQYVIRNVRIILNASVFGRLLCADTYLMSLRASAGTGTFLHLRETCGVFFFFFKIMFSAFLSPKKTITTQIFKASNPAFLQLCTECGLLLLHLLTSGLVGHQWWNCVLRHLSACICASASQNKTALCCKKIAFLYHY